MTADLTLPEIAATIDECCRELGEPDPVWLVCAILDRAHLGNTACRSRVAPPWGRRKPLNWTRDAVRREYRRIKRKQARRKRRT